MLLLTSWPILPLLSRSPFESPFYFYAYPQFFHTQITLHSFYISGSVLPEYDLSVLTMVTYQKDPYYFHIVNRKLKRKNNICISKLNIRLLHYPFLKISSFTLLNTELKTVWGNQENDKTIIYLMSPMFWACRCFNVPAYLYIGFFMCQN